jgi:hypothetical protein
MDSNKTDALLKKLNGILKKSPADIKSCPHTKANPDLRMLVDENLYEVLNEEELLSYAILTGADQILFECSETASSEFKSIFKELPIPVVRSGYGCVRVVTPEELLKKSVISKTKFKNRRTKND